MSHGSGANHGNTHAESQQAGESRSPQWYMDRLDQMRSKSKPTLENVREALTFLPYEPERLKEGKSDQNEADEVEDPQDRHGKVVEKSRKQKEEEKRKAKEEKTKKKEERQNDKKGIAKRFLGILGDIRMEQAGELVDSLSENERFVLMQYLYRGFEYIEYKTSYPLFLTLHSEIVKKDGYIPIIKTIHVGPRRQV